MMARVQVPEAATASEGSHDSKIRQEKRHGLDRVPTELILEIGDYLQVIDLLSLRYTSRRYSTILKTMSRSRAFPMDEKADLWDRLERDRYFKLAEAEARHDAQRLDRLLCSACRQSHSKAGFQLKEMYKSPHIRECLANTTLFRICNHVSLTFAEMKERMARAGPYSCTFIPFLACCDNNLRTEDCSVLYTRDEQVKYTALLLVQSCTPNQPLLRSTLQDFFKQSANPICPHMCGNDDKFVNALEKAPCKESYPRSALPYSPSKDDTEFCVAGGESQMVIWCRAPDCDTRVTITARLWWYGGAVEAYVTRRLGRMKNASDPQWCAQLGVCLE